MKAWPPTPPAEKPCGDALMHLKDNVRDELHQRNMSPADKRLAQYMRALNFGARVDAMTDGPYKRQMVVLFDTVTDRHIRPKLLRVFRVSDEGDGIYQVPTDVTHIGVNNATKRDAHVLADELVGGFYEQYEIAKSMGKTKHFLHTISPERYARQLHAIYERIRERSLEVLKDL